MVTPRLPPLQSGRQRLALSHSSPQRPALPRTRPRSALVFFRHVLLTFCLGAAFSLGCCAGLQLADTLTAVVRRS